MKKGSKVFILLARKVMDAYLRYHMAKAKIYNPYLNDINQFESFVLSLFKLLLVYP